MKHISQGKSSLGIEANIVALLSYFLGMISGIIFFALEKKNKFVRFHAIQSILAFTFLFILSIAVKILPLIGPGLLMLLGITEIILWVTLMVKAYKGEYFKLPIAGKIAEQRA